MDRYAASVYRIARGITGGAEDAEDVVQETFLRAFKHLGSWSPARAGFKTWLFAIARNQSINIFGSVKRRALRFLNEADIDERRPELSDNPFPGQFRDSESLLAMKQEYSRVEQALKKLPERQRTAGTPEGAGRHELRSDRAGHEYVCVVRGVAYIQRPEKAAGDAGRLSGESAGFRREEGIKIRRVRPWISQIPKYVSKLIDYELGENSAEALKSHLAACSACRNTYERMAALNRSRQPVDYIGRRPR